MWMRPPPGTARELAWARFGRIAAQQPAGRRSQTGRSIRYPRCVSACAQGLYGKYGFRTVGRRVGYYTDNHEDAYIMSTESLQDSAYQALLAAHSQALQERLDADEAARSGSRIGS